jgi:hypothetical protein
MVEYFIENAVTILSLMVTTVASGYLYLEKRGEVVLIQYSLDIKYFAHNFNNKISSFNLTLRLLNNSGYKKHIVITQIRYFDGGNFHRLYFTDTELNPAFDIDTKSSFEYTALLYCNEEMVLPIVGFLSRNVSLQVTYTVNGKEVHKFIYGEEFNLIEDWFIR